MGDGSGPGRSEQEDVLGAVWERHRPAVFGVAYRLLGSVADAEDVTQDVWLPEPLLTGPDAWQPVLVVGAVRPLAEAPAAFAPGQRTPGKTIIQVRP